MSLRDPVLILHPADNVGVALEELPAGTRAGAGPLTVTEKIPTGHKLALRAIGVGETVKKYGQAIGTATTDIAPGTHVHIQNLKAELADEKPLAAGLLQLAAPTGLVNSFAGFRRPAGRTGTRNYVGVIATVNCSATVIRQIARNFEGELRDRYPHVDGVCPITHSSGCGLPRDGEGLALLRRTLGGYLRHPNMGAVLLVGLGCEVNDIRSLLAALDLDEGDRLRTLAIQDAGGTRAAIERGTQIVYELLAEADKSRREPVDVGELTLALQCGGSDSFSGVTANPALGVAADLLVAAGGTVILGETPEIYGAEHLLLQRAESAAVASALRGRLAWWQRYVAASGTTLDNNPSPGNIAGGISTILEKSLGAVMKSGTTPLRGVYNYAENIDSKGFVFMDSPGFDPCSITGEIASGANVVAFTTGRGSVFGAKPVPSIKLASNSSLARRLADDIDYDCGQILDGTRSLREAGVDIFNLIVDTASGRESASERNGLGDFEFVPWQIGAVL